MTVLIVEPGNCPRIAEIDDNLKAMQEIVGGLIQAIYPFEEPVALICNNEGKLLGLPLNRELRDEQGRAYDIISGTFFLCGAPPDTDHFVSLSEEQIGRYEKRFHAPECFLKVGDRLLCLPIA